MMFRRFFSSLRKQIRRITKARSKKSSEIVYRVKRKENSRTRRRNVTRRVRRTSHHRVRPKTRKRVLKPKRKARSPQPKAHSPKPTAHSVKLKIQSSKSKTRRVKALPKISQVAQKPQGVLVGEITHYFSKIQVCVIKMTQGEIRIGDTLRIVGPGRHFTQKVASLQIENSDVNAARKGDLVGMKIKTKVREGDRVFKVL